ncbi:uncharacterized protein FOMMEDRAFT_24963 [Fomitiporia mediterranea MF3/22]|uniref:uncharacterized protein n=1 Tax=Fomitiporia mediterranea (strain MF3/22) TaxID=694068 RepID=UPI00044093FD|nr:uncharacterized protein FOMMEDRAFT_24963 [Fomitiporia mediterranea MF3/22]EJD07646.1 hypothetical protein FOMMEDRAFT_24963 [Fomitiporia mediterranea MF3/22]
MYDVMQTTLSADIAELKQDVLIRGNTGAARHTKGLTGTVQSIDEDLAIAYVLYGFEPENRIRKFDLSSLVSLDDFGYLGGDKELEQNKSLWILDHPEVYGSLQKKRKAVNLLLGLLQTFQRLACGSLHQVLLNMMEHPFMLTIGAQIINLVGFSLEICRKIMSSVWGKSN